MYKITIVIILITGFWNSTFAQDKTVKNIQETATRKLNSSTDTTNKAWKKGASFALNLNQGSLSNWSAGGEKFSFSLNSYFTTYADYEKNKHRWMSALDLAYGVVSTTSLGSRKASDRIDLTSKYGYSVSKKTDVGGLINFRSQFANGFGYDEDVNGDDSAFITSRSLQPAYILISPGINYRPAKNLSVFLSPASARWVIVRDQFLKPIYNVPLDQSARQEFGAFATVNFQSNFARTMFFKTKLDLFSNYKNNPKNIDVFFTNVLTAKLTKYLNFSLNVDVIYDDDTNNTEAGKGPAPQVLQLMGIGFAYSINPKN